MNSSVNKRKSRFHFKNLAIFLPLLFILIVISLFSTIYVYQNYSITELALRIRGSIVDYGIFAPVLFSVCYIVIASLGFSTTILSLLAVSVFSSPVAIIVIILSTTISGIIIFLLARKHASVPIKIKPGTKSKNTRLLARINNSKNFQRYVPHFLQETVVVFLLRIIRMPYTATSYALGFATNYRFSHYVIGTLMANIIVAIIIATIGAAIFHILVPFAIALLIILNLGIIYKKLLRTKLAK